MLNALPAPNLAGRTNNYQALLLTNDYQDKYDAKIDGQINSQDDRFPSLEPAQAEPIQSARSSRSFRGGNGTGTFVFWIRLQPQATHGL